MQNLKKWLCGVLAGLVLATGIACMDDLPNYARNLGLSPSVIDELGLLGPKMDEYEKAFVELLSNYSEPVQMKLVEQITGDSKVSGEEVDALDYLSGFPGEVQGEFIDHGLDAEVVNFLITARALPDQGFAQYAVINKLCIGDGQLTDLESKFLTEPEKYSGELLTQYLLDLESIYPEVADEMGKLPDLGQITIENVEATEDILDLSCNPENSTFFEAILNEGIRDKRKYCTPLQALVWLAYDEEEFITTSVSLLVPSSLIWLAWVDTSTSQNYASDKWRDFDKVVDRLNSPNMVSVYIIDCIPYSMERHDFFVKYARSLNWLSLTMTPKEVFEKKIAVCQDHSRFALYCLIGNGYTYNNFDKYPDKAACILEASNEQAKPLPSGSHRHFVCMYVENGNFYMIDDRLIRRQSLVRGPFKTIEEAAEVTHPGWNEYKFYDINMKITNRVFRK